MNNEEAMKVYEEASKKGTKLAGDLLLTSANYIEPTAITLGAATGAVFGSIYKAKDRDLAKRWLEAFFMTMTGGLRETMKIDISVQWAIKED